MRVIAAVAAAIIMTVPGDALACSCIGQTREEAFRNTDLIFEGVIQSIEVRPGEQDELFDDPDLPSPPTPITGRVATFAVEREIKGVGQALRAVDYNVETGGNCGMEFEIGKRYRVFADEYDGRWLTGSCSSTRELLLAPGERNYGALAGAELQAAASPDDPIAQWRPERIRSEIDDEYFFRNYLAKVDLGETPDLRRIGAAFKAAFEAQDRERAEAIARRAVAAFGDDAESHVMLARALSERSQLDEALAAAERALGIDPDSIEARDEAERLRFLVRGETMRGRRDYRKLFAKSLIAQQCVAPKADFSDSAFGEADFSGAMLDGARFRRLVAPKALFVGARLAGARFDEAGGWGGFGGRMGIYGFGADFSKANLRGASFVRTEFSSVIFDSADLRGVDFKNAVIEDARFTGSRVEGAKFTGAKFYTTRMDGAALGDADFSDALAANISWRGADLRLATLDRADLRGGIIDCATKLPRGFDHRRSGLIPERPVCAGKAQNRDFSGLNWPFFLRVRGFDLKGADFKGGDFSNAEFQNADLSGADFSEAKGDAAFSGADLTDASFRGAELAVQFTAFTDEDKIAYGNAKLDRTDFSGAKLDAADFLTADKRDLQFEIDLSTAKFDGARIDCGGFYGRDDIEALEEAENGNELDDMTVEERELRLAYLRLDAGKARVFLAAEGEVVRYLAARWPTIKFDDACKGYLNGDATE